MLKKFTLSAAATAAVLTAMPAAAQAQGYYRDGYRDSYSQNYRGDRYNRYDRGDRYYGRNYRSSRNQYRRCSGTTGTIVGGAAGALLGREVGKSSCRR